MITENNGFALGGDPHMTDVAVGAVQNLAYRGLQSLLTAATAHDSELFSILRDVAIADFLKQQTGRTPAQRDLSQRPDGHPVQSVMPSQTESHLTVRGHAQNICRRQSEATRFQSFKSCAEYLEGLVVPGCTIDDVLSVGSEASGFDVAASKDELMEGRKAGLVCTQAEEKAPRQHQQRRKRSQSSSTHFSGRRSGVQPGF